IVGACLAHDLKIWDDLGVKGRLYLESPLRCEVKFVFSLSSLNCFKYVSSLSQQEVQRLSDYLQEALWREETVKKKLAVLTEISTNLVNSSDVLWTSRCSEDLLRSKIKVLEAQLQVCLQKFPKDGVKKLMLQMEKQRGTYEEKALVALQKATQEKADALCQAETLQEALVTAQAEALRWQSLYKELMLSSGQLRENHHLSNDQLQQLHTEVQVWCTRRVKRFECKKYIQIQSWLCVPCSCPEPERPS
uniref:TRAF3 interacting protein 3 n=1 Tax=Poecilia latipinna TaxID=48699 RepID=A0A3B3TNL8_9TELE